MYAKIQYSRCGLPPLYACILLRLNAIVKKHSLVSFLFCSRFHPHPIAFEICSSIPFLLFTPKYASFSFPFVASFSFPFVACIQYGMLLSLPCLHLLAIVFEVSPPLMLHLKLFVDSRTPVMLKWAPFGCPSLRTFCTNWTASFTSLSAVVGWDVPSVSFWVNCDWSLLFDVSRIFVHSIVLFQREDYSNVLTNIIRITFMMTSFISYPRAVEVARINKDLVNSASILCFLTIRWVNM